MSLAVCSRPVKMGPRSSSGAGLKHDARPSVSKRQPRVAKTSAFGRLSSTRLEVVEDRLSIRGARRGARGDGEKDGG